jgi:hypothetical protein
MTIVDLKERIEASGDFVVFFSTPRISSCFGTKSRPHLRKMFAFLRQLRSGRYNDRRCLTVASNSRPNLMFRQP